MGDRDGLEPELLDWLLEGDPSIRWQVMADLTDAGPAAAEAERRRVATDGWGARLLAEQDADGLWAGALYSPKWTSTTYTLLLLHWLGLPSRHPQALLGCRRLWDEARFFDGGVTLAKTVRQPETCITAMLVLLDTSFGLGDHRLDASVDWLIGQQLDDGGWNCQTVHTGSQHGSFHTSIFTLEALLAYQRSGGSRPVADALAEGHRFFLDHRLYRSHRTGAVVDAAFTRFPFPPQWHFDVLRGLDHFRLAGACPDERLADAVEVVRRARKHDGRWPMHQGYSGRTWFRMEPPGASRWTTLRALRVLQWWERGAGAVSPAA